MKFLDVAIPHFGDDEPQEHVPKPPAPDPRRHRSHKRQPIEEYTLDDYRSVMSEKAGDKQDDEVSLDGRGGDQFYEARDDTTEVGVPK